MTRLQPTKSPSRPSQARRLWAAVAFVLALVVAFFPAETASAAGPVVVASKIDTEGALLGNMIADVVAARGIAVDRRIQLGPTNIVRAALLAGQIDLYPEYTGNGGIFFHRDNDPAWKNAAQGYDEVKKLDAAQNRIVWLDPAPARRRSAPPCRRTAQ